MQTASGNIYIQLLEGDRDWIEVMEPSMQDLEMIFRRVNNTVIHRLTVSFGRRATRLLHYLRTNANELMCRIRTLRVQVYLIDIDYTLVDFLGTSLEPEVCEMQLLSDNFVMRYATLFTHSGLSDTVKHLQYEVSNFRANVTRRK